MSLIAEKLTYTTAAGSTLFDDLDFSLEKGMTVGITGKNGMGKSLLLQILAGKLEPSTGQVHRKGSLWHVPQHFGQFDRLTVESALGIDAISKSLEAIAHGSVDPSHYSRCEGNWDILERCEQSWEKWGLMLNDPKRPFSSLSGGQKTRLLLSGTDIHRPDCLLLDEPSNHLDREGRSLLLEILDNTGRGTVAVSHDRELLDRCEVIYELSETGLKKYGGDYTFYVTRKEVEVQALRSHIEHAEHSVKKSRLKLRETQERKEKTNARGKKEGRSGSMPRILANARKSQAERSASRLKGVHLDKLMGEQRKLQDLRAREQQAREIRIRLGDSLLHRGKVLFKADRVNFRYDSYGKYLWKTPLDCTIYSGDRVVLTGNNGSGKSTLVRLLTGDLTPSHGKLEAFTGKILVIDQEYRQIDRTVTVLEQATRWKKKGVLDHELKTFLTHCLFEKESWNKHCAVLSGGEMLRLTLCCMALSQENPDVVILDEPTNNIDLDNLKILEEAVAAYQGTLIAISHDLHFLEKAGVDKIITLYQNTDNNHV
jgi:ATPase subunit of ABC transporter with duplicated ATPase domains